jgi:hypothetical protein
MTLQARQKSPPTCVQKHFSTLCKFGNGKQVYIRGGFVSPGHYDRGGIHQERERIGQEMAKIGHGLSAIEQGMKWQRLGVIP